MSKRIDDFSKARDIAQNVAYSLRGLATAFDVTGNVNLSHDLFDLYEALDTSIQGMDEAFGGLINDYFKESQAAFYAPLKTILNHLEKE